MEYQMFKHMLFNGRRPGDIDRRKLNDFLNRCKTYVEDVYIQELDPQEKQQAEKYEKMFSEGKKMDGKGSILEQRCYKCTSNLSKVSTTGKDM